MSFKGEIIMSCPRHPFTKAELVQTPLDFLIIFTTLPPPPHTKYNVIVEVEKLEN